MASKLCMGCMGLVPDGESRCPECGYPAGGINPPEYLRVRTVLNDRYLVGRVLEVSGDSAVYIGMDKKDRSRVTIREFYPNTLCERGEDGQLHIIAGCEGTFEEYKQKFLATARAVARLRDVLAVVPVYDIFEVGCTAFFIGEFGEGVSLEKYVRENGHLSFEEARKLFLPLLSSVSMIHTAGLLHLGISPRSILVDPDGTLRLKNFCIPETHTVNTECKPTLIAGYSAPEQYELEMTCTPAADVYGLAASLYFALSGRQPTDASQRIKQRSDELLMPADVADTLPDHVKETLYRAMRLDPGRRTKTAQRLLDELTATSAIAALIEEEEQEEVPEEQKKEHSYLWLIFIGVTAALAILAVFALSGLGYINLGKKPAVTTTTQQNLTLASTTATRIITKPTGAVTYAVENLVGRTYESVATLKLTGNMTVSVKGYEYNSAPKGSILSQTPAAGEQVESGTAISVVISAGEAEQKLPDLSGWNEAHARLYLEALGYRVGESMLLQVSERPRGEVEYSTPAAGTKVKPGDLITLWVSDVKTTKQ